MPAPGRPWASHEIVTALRADAERLGRAPTEREWATAEQDRPSRGRCSSAMGAGIADSKRWDSSLGVAGRAFHGERRQRVRHRRWRADRGRAVLVARLWIAPAKRRSMLIDVAL
jgi:hypothetical protein